MRDGFIKVAAAAPIIRVADTEYNADAVIGVMRRAAAAGVKLLVLPELCITGCTCGDLFLQHTLLSGAKDALLNIAAASAGSDMLTFVGLPLADSGRLYNCAAAVCNGRILGIVPKTNVSNYAESRWFTGADVSVRTVTVGSTGIPFGANLLLANTALPELVIGVELGTDLWVPNPPSIRHAMCGATVIVNPAAESETVAKDDYRRGLVSGQSARLVCGYIYANAGLGESTQDAVYTGHSLICENGVTLSEVNTDASLIVSELDLHRIDAERRRMGTFTAPRDGYTIVPWHCAPTETKLTRTVDKTPFFPAAPALLAQRCEKILTLQALGLKRRLEHTRAKKLVVGVSGGLDSTLALLVCARALDLAGRSRCDITAVTMPCFGTTQRTRSNAELLAEYLGAELITVDITAAVRQHFADIGHDAENYNVVFENAQARERTQVLMDIANGSGGLVVGTGDLSELALGWATYNGDHMSMYGVNGGIPKTLMRHLVDHVAETCGNAPLADVLRSILATPVSPELLPAENGEISQKTEDLVGPYELHDFYLYYAIRWGMPPRKVYRLALYAFDGVYSRETILFWLKTFYRRFFNQQFKRSCLPDGPKIGTLTLSPRGDWMMPSDAVAALWLGQLETLK